MRLVCRSLNAILVAHLFRNVHIRLRWDGLRINPPLRELSIGGTGAEVFQRNVKALRISALFRPEFTFSNDCNWEGESEYRMAQDPDGVYPEPMRTKLQKLKMHLFELEDMKSHLFNTIKSMEHLQELRCARLFPYLSTPLNLFQTFRCEISEFFCPSWYIDVLLNALSAAKNLQTLHLERPYGRGWSNINYVSFLKLVPLMCDMHNLKNFELTSLDGPQEWLVKLWRMLTKSDVSLESITTDSISVPQLEYLASYSGLKTLACAAIHIGAPVRNPNIHILKTIMFDEVIPHHQDTLLDFRLPFIESWFVDSSNIGALAQCRRLRFLTTNFLVGGVDAGLVDFVSVSLPS